MTTPQAIIIFTRDVTPNHLPTLTAFLQKNHHLAVYLVAQSFRSPTSFQQSATTQAEETLTHLGEQLNIPLQHRLHLEASSSTHGQLAARVAPPMVIADWTYEKAPCQRLPKLVLRPPISAAPIPA
jgi:hypothetical protein